MNKINISDISIVIPAKNESLAIGGLVEEICSLYQGVEVIVVDDGSDDGTGDIAKKAGAKVITHPYSKGNGAAIKAGARKASGEWIVFMDGDGQHKPEDITRFIEKIEIQGFDMVVGSRDFESQASLSRGFGNALLNKFATYMVGRKIEDLTSGFRMVRASIFKKFIYLLPNGFSYPTTITMAFFRAGYNVDYMPITALKRKGDSHIRVVQDGVKFLLIIFKVGTLFSPLKVFLPVAMFQIMLAISYYMYTYVYMGRLTNMTVILFVSAIFIFLIGLISEQITALIYKDHE